MKTTKGGKVMNPTDAFRKEQRKKELKRVSSSSQTLGFVSCYHPARAGPGPCGGGGSGIWPWAEARCDVPHASLTAMRLVI